MPSHPQRLYQGEINRGKMNKIKERKEHQRMWNLTDEYWTRLARTALYHYTTDHCCVELVSKHGV